MRYGRDLDEFQDKVWDLRNKLLDLEGSIQDMFTDIFLTLDRIKEQGKGKGKGRES